MIAAWVKTPFPAWEGIGNLMVDDSGYSETKGCFVGVFDGDKMAGAFLVRPWSDYCYEVHGGVSREYWGKGAEICETFGLFLFKNTSCVKIVAIVPVFNHLMIKCLRKIGMKYEGNITKSFMKNMQLHDQVIYCRNKSEVDICLP